MAHRPTWSIEHDVREDAESIFVPATTLPRARPGDIVEIRTGHAPVRYGRVVDRVDDEGRGEFVTVDLETERGRE